ncbi:hypothetical protein [Actibacterium sp. MT2.3-13A]|uniref:hypothetical protein n=1 Tax=Actibacterium sp. MT2.3-13A TaxID=2828332 RepID=UPI001BA82575|nr:hypothetical protein [Actibacterium sp. MT2.3-13A]
MKDILSEFAASTRVTMRAAAQVAALVGATVLNAATGPVSITMDENSGLYTISWLGTPDRIIVRWKLITAQGEIYVCGNYALKGHSMNRLSQKAIRDVAIRMDDKIIVQDLSYFTRLQSEGQLIGGMAACKGTGAAAPKERGHTFSIGSGKKVYRD